MGSDVTGFSQSVESKSDKRSTELHHHSFDPEEISILLLFRFVKSLLLCCCFELQIQRIPHLIVENSLDPSDLCCAARIDHLRFVESLFCSPKITLNSSDLRFAATPNSEYGI